MAHPLESYLESIKRVYSTGGGTKEESYYGALETLINELGHRLRPRVFCVQQLQNKGGGEPDFGLFVSSQKQNLSDLQILQGQLPERGVVEAKSWTEELSFTVEGSQVKKYLDRYGLLLLTNYRAFAVVSVDSDGKARLQESISLAETPDAFVTLFSRPRSAAKSLENRIDDFLSLALRRNAPLDNPQDLAWFLASYAREARGRVEAKAELPALEALKQALGDALGLEFTGEKALHFFHATFVQTLFYGIFSAWVLWSRNSKNTGKKFNWHETQWGLNIPLLSSLFSQIATKDRLQPLGVDEVLDWATAALNRVDWARFILKFEDEMAVQYFYEPFLKAYDPELRKELGVWYTPPEIVKYQVERVDRVLRDELDLPDGLADPKVLVLDPCCGTGAYLVETLRRIHQTLVEKGDNGLAAQKVKQAAMERVFGFEILPAPYVVSHLQLGLMLQQNGAPLRADKGERVGVYLTNALTGWEPPEDPKKRMELLTELAQERQAADSIKRDKMILVVLGNPPYNAFAGISPAEEHGLVEPYKELLGKSVADGGWGIKNTTLMTSMCDFLELPSVEL